VTDLPAGITETKVHEIFEAYGHVLSTRVFPSRLQGHKTCASLVRFASCEEAIWVVDHLNGNIPEGLSRPVGVRFSDTPEIRARKQAGQGKVQPSTQSTLVEAAASPVKVEVSVAKARGETRAAPYPGGGTTPSRSNDVGTGYAGSMAASKKPTNKVRDLHDGLMSSGMVPGGNIYTKDDCTLCITNLPTDSTELDLYKIFAPFGAVAPTGVRAMLNLDGSCKGIGFVSFLHPDAAKSAVVSLDGTILSDGTTLCVKMKNK